MTSDLPRGHMCPMCKTVAAPIYWAVCAKCFRILPTAMGHALVHAWRHRVLDPARWLETLAGALEWRRGNTGPRPMVYAPTPPSSTIVSSGKNSKKGSQS